MDPRLILRNKKLGARQANTLVLIDFFFRIVTIESS
jgi:hypothetical protein